MRKNPTKVHTHTVNHSVITSKDIIKHLKGVISVTQANNDYQRSVSEANIVVVPTTIKDNDDFCEFIWFEDVKSIRVAHKCEFRKDLQIPDCLRIETNDGTIYHSLYFPVQFEKAGIRGKFNANLEQHLANLKDEADLNSFESQSYEA